MVKFYKIRALMFLLLVRGLSKVFAVEAPPVISAAGFIKKDGKILFLKLSYLKGYGLPGGVVKPGEDIENALKREVLEETGLRVTSHKYLWSISSSFKGVPTVSMFFEVETTGDVRGSNEGSLEWLSPTEELSNNMAYDNTKVALLRYIGKSL